MKDILEIIVENKRIEVARQKEAVRLQTLIKMATEGIDRQTKSMRASLNNNNVGIIAEFKRKSPSKGWLHAEAKVEDVVPVYEKSGAAACSILTDRMFFGGSLSDLKLSRKLVDLPLLRKDFIIDPYQIYQAKAFGADAVLLIAACLNEDECNSMSELAHSLSLEVLLEIHTAAELKYLNPHIDMLGVNNRNLGTFATDIENSHNLSELIKEETSKRSLNPLLVSESGIRTHKDISRLKKDGYKGFLIGETLMKNNDPANIIRSLKGEIS